MKKILAVVLAAVMLMSVMLTLTSCSLFGPKPDVKMSMKKIAKALEDEDYLVSTEKEPDVMIKQYLSAYTEDDSLQIIWFEDTAMAKLYYKELKMDLDHKIESAKLEIKAGEKYLDLYDSDLDDDDAEEREEELEEMEEELEEIKNICIGRKGNVVWKGTKNAIEDSKG